MSYPSFNDNENINISNIDRTHNSINEKEKENNQTSSISKIKLNNDSSLISSSYHNYEEHEDSLNPNQIKDNLNYNSDRTPNDQRQKKLLSNFVNNENDDKLDINDNYNYKSESRNNSYSKLKKETSNDIKKDIKFFPEDNPIKINNQEIDNNEVLNENKTPEDTIANLNNKDNNNLFQDNIRINNTENNNLFQDNIRVNNIENNNLFQDNMRVNNKINDRGINENHNSIYSPKKEQKEEIYNQTIINLNNNKKRKVKKNKKKKKIKDRSRCCCKIDCNSRCCAYCCGNRGFIGFFCCLICGFIICFLIAKAIWH